MSTDHFDRRPSLSAPGNPPARGFNIVGIRNKVVVRLLAVATAVGGVVAAISGLAGATGLPASAAGITPTQRGAVSDCTASGTSHIMGIKVAKSDLASYGVTIDQNSSDVSATHKPNNAMRITISNAALSGGSATFNWSSNLPVDYVFVTSGSSTVAYDYSGYSWGGHPASGPFGDSSLVSSSNGISNILFCTLKKLRVERTASGSVARKIEWAITKEVKTGTGAFGPTATLGLMTGAQGEATWKIVATKKGLVDSDPTVTGKVTVLNASPFAANVSLGDSLAGTTFDAGCASFSLAIAAAKTCGTSVKLPAATAGTSTVTATPTNLGWMGTSSAAASFDFSTVASTVNGTVRWLDSNGQTKSGIVDTDTVEYPTTYACDRDKGARDNLVTLYGDDAKTPLGQAKATVTITCTTPPKKLTLTTGASLQWHRVTSWSVKKTASPASHALLDGKGGTSTWTINVAKTGVESTFFVDGTVSVTNPNGSAVTNVAVKSSVAGFDLLCAKGDGVKPFTIAAGETVKCTFHGTVSSAAAGSTSIDATADGGLGASGPASWIALEKPNAGDVNPTVAVIDERLQKVWTANGSEDDKTFTESFPCANGSYTNTVELQGDNPATAGIETTSKLGSDSASVTTSCSTTPEPPVTPPTTPQPPVTPPATPPTTPQPPVVSPPAAQPKAPFTPPVKKPVRKVVKITHVTKKVVVKKVVKKVVIKKVVKKVAKPNPCAVISLSVQTVPAGKRSPLALWVTAGGKSVEGAKVRILGPGIARTVTSGPGGKIEVGVRPSTAGIVTLEIVNKKSCSQARIGVVAPLEPPVTG